MDFLAVRIAGKEGLETGESVIRAVASRLEKGGYVKDTYADAVAERERSYPTGLELGGGVNVAIPHTEARHVITSAMVFAPLEREVRFGLLGDPERFVPIKMVVMLAISDPQEQVPMLRSLMRLLQNRALVETLLASSDVDEIKRLVLSGFETA